MLVNELKVLFHIQKEKADLKDISTSLIEDHTKSKNLLESKEIVNKFRNPEKLTLNFSTKFIELLNEFLVDLEKTNKI